MNTEVGPSAATLIKIGPDQAMRLLSRLWVPGDEELVRRTIRGLVDLVESMERHGAPQAAAPDTIGPAVQEALAVAAKFDEDHGYRYDIHHLRILAAEVRRLHNLTGD